MHALPKSKPPLPWWKPMVAAEYRPSQLSLPQRHPHSVLQRAALASAP